jgi:hypothetical protein
MLTYIFLLNVFFYLTSDCFVVLFFWKSRFFKSRSHVMNDRLVELTRADLNFFSWFFMAFIFIFFQFHHFTLNYLSLNFVIFSLFFPFHYFEGGSACIFFLSAFYLTSVFFVTFFFWKSIFLFDFFPWFFMTLFFQFHHFALNYLSSSFVIFSLFFLFDYSENGLVKLTQVGLNIFYWTLIYPSFGSLFFLIPISCREWRIGQVNLSWLDFFSSLFYGSFFFSLISLFCIKLFVLELCHFFFFLFYYFKGGLVKLI